MLETFPIKVKFNVEWWFPYQSLSFCLSSMVKKLIIALSRRQILWYVDHAKDKTSKARTHQTLACTYCTFRKITHVKAKSNSWASICISLKKPWANWSTCNLSISIHALSCFCLCNLINSTIEFPFFEYSCRDTQEYSS